MADLSSCLRREAEFLTMLDSPRIVECLDVVDDGRQQVGSSPSLPEHVFPCIGKVQQAPKGLP